jgi:hypothetical protein
MTLAIYSLVLLIAVLLAWWLLERLAPAGWSALTHRSEKRKTERRG